MAGTFLLILTGASYGLLAAAGVFTVLISVGLIPRFAGKMHVANKVFVLEEAVIFGTLTGSFFSVYSEWAKIGDFVRLHEIFGPAATEGAWNLIGTLIQIAEMLNTIPVFARRIGFRHGLGVAILAVALGKLAGSLIYFTQHFF